MPSASPHSHPPTHDTHPDIPPFPSPSTFSILPDIYLLIARLNILQTQPQTQSSSQNGPASSQPSAQSQSQPHPQPAPATQQASQPTSTSTTSSSSQPPFIASFPPLDTKDLPSHIYPIKQRLAKARAAVSSLPDVERTVEEQEREIAKLERVVIALRGRLELLGRIAKSREQEGESGDVVMKGMEEEQG